jgi:hypothetical protein
MTPQLLHRSKVLLLLIVLLPACSPPAFSQSPASPPDAEPREIKAVQLASPPVIDGVLNDAAWQSPPMSLGTWLSYNPMFGEKLAQQTEVWLAYDREYLYFAFRCLDPEPSGIKTSITRRDTQWNDDWVGLGLDTLGTRQGSYEMFVNPSGIQGDILNSNTSGEAVEPDWVWDSAAKRNARGYEVEIRLPLKSIRFRSGPQVRMAILFWRRVSRLGMSASWPSLPPGKPFFDRHAVLVLGELKQPVKLDLIPNATYSWNQERQAPTQWGEADSQPDAGITVKYGITSNTTLDGTYRPDFSQVESDAFQIEVNRRYPVFYGEKRPFFMEGMGTFELAGSGGDGNMRTAVHTRKIIDPLYGLKLTGSAGKLNFATLSASDEGPGTGDVAAPLLGKSAYFNIARAVYSLNKGRYVGGLLVDRRFGNGYNRVGAGDVVLPFRENHRFSATMIGTRSRDSGAATHRSGMAGQTSYNFNTKRYSLNLQLEHYDTNFRMDTAFYNRTGYSGGNFYFARSFYPDQKKHAWFKRFVPFVFAQGGKDRPQGGAETFAMAGVRFHFTRQGFLRFDGARGQTPWRNHVFQTRLWRLMGGGQAFGWLNLQWYSSFNPRSVYYDSEIPYAGRERYLSLSGTWQPSSRINQQLSVDRSTFFRLAGGERVYAVSTLNSRTTYQFDRRFSVRTIVRYGSSRKRILADFLAAYEFVPGTVAYAGYGALYDRRGWDGTDWLPGQGSFLNTRRGFFFKVSYLYRL